MTPWAGPDPQYPFLPVRVPQCAFDGFLNERGQRQLPHPGFPVQLIREVDAHLGHALTYPHADSCVVVIVALTVLICYDISREASRAGVVAFLQQWGDRIQCSGYVCAVTPEELSELVSRVEQMIDPATDAVRLLLSVRVLVAAGGPRAGGCDSGQAAPGSPVTTFRDCRCSVRGMAPED